MSEILQPCPFCGGPPVLFVRACGGGIYSGAIDVAGDQVTVFVFCHECGAEGPHVTSPDPDGWGDIVFYEKDIQKMQQLAVDRWHERSQKGAPCYEPRTWELWTQ